MKRKELNKDELKREREMLLELKKFHKENAHLAAPVATNFTKKRIRVPTLQPETNPFCMERQLADEYALLNLNKVLCYLGPGWHFHEMRSSSLLVAVSCCLLESSVLYPIDQELTASGAKPAQPLQCTLLC